MKKIIGFFMALALLVTLSACGVKPTATVENPIIKRSSYSFDLKVEDKDIVTKGSVLVNFYKISKKEEELVSTKTLSTFSENVSVTGLVSDTDYRADVVCTYNKKEHIIYSWTFKTNVKGTEYDPIMLTSAQELVDNLTNDYSSDAFYCLANDIDFAEYKDDEGNAKVFAGLSSTSSSAFCGHLDGKGYSIKNVTVTTTQTYNGFFGYLKGYLDNITFENVNVNVTRDSSTTTYSGIVCGYAYQAKMNNVTLKDCKLTVDAKSQYNGSLAGYGFASNFNYSKVNNLEISSTSGTTVYTGGITGYLCQNSSSKYGKIYDCTVDGKITIASSTTLYYGGLVGLFKAGSEINRGIANIDADIHSTGASRIGGIIGQANLNSVDNDVYIKNVVAKGKITYKTIKETEVIEATDTLVIGGLVGSATAVNIDSAYVEMDLDIETKIAEEKELFVGLAFGNGYELHTELHNAIINGSITALTDGSHDAAKINIHGYDGSTYIISGDEKPSSTIDSETVKCVKISITIGSDTQEYPSIALTDAVAAVNWDKNIWDVTESTDSLDIKFKN